MKDNILDVPGIKVGHSSDFENGTGCTVIICENGAVGGVDVCGTATGSREVLTLSPVHITPKVHSICLAGGSAFGLASADGVMRYLEERGIGYQARVAIVPIVPSAIIFDLSFKNSKVRPDARMGYEACLRASDEFLEQGSVGAGTGATVGKIMGQLSAMKSGIGSSSIICEDGLIVSALAVVNNFGDVLDYRTGKILAGAIDPKTWEFLDVTRTLAKTSKPLNIAMGENTNLAVVVTNAKLSKVEASKVAMMAQAGFARTLSPVHSSFDGDIIFALSAGEFEAELNRVGILSAEVLARAVNRAVEHADGLGVLPALKDVLAKRGLRRNE